MGERDEPPSDDPRDERPVDESVDPVMEDFDDVAADVKIYECEQCGNRVEAEHQPGTCPVCGGEMVDISVSRE